MLEEIKFTGNASILQIINCLPGKAKAVRVYGNSITIPTQDGARDVYKGDIVVIDGDNVTIRSKK